MSIHSMQQERDLVGCLLFAVLLNMKHLYAYAGPVFLVYTLRHYCTLGTAAHGFVRFVSVGIAVLSVFVLSFGPFILLGQVKQVWI